MLHPTLRIPLVPLLLGAAACSGGPAPASSPAPSGGGDPVEAAPVVQPGAPGESTRSVDPSEVVGMGDLGHTEADVHFMQGMIPHHAQALQMTALVPARTPDDGFRRMALRMEISQRDEIALMSRWLEDRGEEVPASAAMAGGGGASMDHAAHGMSGGAGMHGMGDMPRMPGMLSPEQMARLEAAEGLEFERLFLEYMIMHHQGAIYMVDRLFSAPGGGQETEVFRFASDVDADQAIEIRRMQQMLEARGGPVDGDAGARRR
jgi:uncharacterized protein (DUF305 family)